MAGGSPRLDQATRVELAQPACFRSLWESNPHTTLLACSEDVGLPDGQFGNSEVGHMNLGAGRIVYQEITRIDRDIREGRFFDLAALKQALKATAPRKAGDKGGRIHLMGLVSDGGVHSIDRHYFALIDWLKHEGFCRGKRLLPCDNRWPRHLPHRRSPLR